MMGFGDDINKTLIATIKFVVALVGVSAVAGAGIAFFVLWLLK